MGGLAMGKKHIAIIAGLVIALICLAAFSTKKSRNFIYDLFFTRTIEINESVKFYDKTVWGMPLDEVRRLYPDGLVETDNDGDIAYEVDGKVDQHTHKSIFRFDRNRRLISVLLMFYSTSNPRIVFSTEEEATRIRSDIFDLLKIKYGEPNQDLLQVEGSTDSDWVGKHTLISLKVMQADPTANNSFGVQVAYHSEYEIKQKHRTEGL
jgi:hypothetical protein